MWKVLHSRWTVVFWVEWSVLQWTVCGRYYTAGGLWYWGLNDVCYSELYVEGTAQHVDCGIVGWMVCVTVNIMWKLLHSRWTVVLCLLNGVCCSEHYVEGTAQQVDSGIVGWMYCVTVNSMWKVLHSRWTFLLWLNGLCYSEQYVEGTAQQVDSGIVGWMECVTVNSMWKLLHSRWTVVLWVEWSVLQWTLCGSYCTAGGQCYCRLNGVCYSENYLEDISQQVEIFRGQWYWSFSGVCFSDLYLYDTAQQVDSVMEPWNKCVLLNFILKSKTFNPGHILLIGILIFVCIEKCFVN